ncbi:hypothetical protein ACIPR8_11130 [Stenotrophomonas sp. LARHCG68]
MDMTKTSVKLALGLKSDACLARIFGIGRWAVGQWGEDKPIPRLRQLELAHKFPEQFDSDGRVIAFGADVGSSEVGKAVALGSS